MKKILLNILILALLISCQDETTQFDCDYSAEYSENHCYLVKCPQYLTVFEVDFLKYNREPYPIDSVKTVNQCGEVIFEQRAEERVDGNSSFIILTYNEWDKLSFESTDVFLVAYRNGDIVHKEKYVFEKNCCQALKMEGREQIVKIIH